MTWLALILLAVIAAAPFVLERRKPDMDDEVRAGVPGKIAMLSDGHTHYQWHGPKDGPVLVCIHGLTTPSYVWEALMPGLTEAGFRVLTYDLYGRGFSDRPGGAQTRSFFIRQLRDLLDDQGVTDNITLLGYSMGGSIATVFASEEPERVYRMILLAPAGMEHSPSLLAKITARVPLVGDWLMLTFGGYELRRIADADPATSAIASRQRAEPGWRGYLPAVLSSQRHMLADTLQEEHRNIANAGVKANAIWGELDTVIPLTAMGSLTQWNRFVGHATIPGAGHALGVTHPTEVIAALADLLGD